MTRLTFPLILTTTVLLFAQDAPGPVKALVDAATHAEQTAQMARAKLYLLTLVRTFDGPEATRAKTEIGAVYIFADAQSLEIAGKTREAWETYGTVAQIYPESPLSALAIVARQKLDPERKWMR